MSSLDHVTVVSEESGSNALLSGSLSLGGNCRWAIVGEPIPTAAAIATVEPDQESPAVANADQSLTEDTAATTEQSALDQTTSEEVAVAAANSKSQSPPEDAPAGESQSPNEAAPPAAGGRNRFGHRRKYDKRQAIPTSFVNQLMSQNAQIEIEQKNPKRGKSAEVYDR
jgi:hypothetical protein